MTLPSAAAKKLSQEDYETLAAFRYELRCFLQSSEKAAKSVGLTPQQHQALLAIRADPLRGMTVYVMAEQLFIQPRSASEPVDCLIGLDLVTREAAGDDRRRDVAATDIGCDRPTRSTVDCAPRGSRARAPDAERDSSSTTIAPT